MKAHSGDPFAKRHPDSLTWKDRDGEQVCGYCGSMTVEAATFLLTTTGTEYSGADWKYGWPHKFYIGQKKFYNEHLLDAEPALLARFADLTAALLGIRFELDAEGLKYRSLGSGFQTWGLVDGPPATGAPRVPADWWK